MAFTSARLAGSPRRVARQPAASRQGRRVGGGSGANRGSCIHVRKMADIRPYCNSFATASRRIGSRGCPSARLVGKRVGLARPGSGHWRQSKFAGNRAMSNPSPASPPTFNRLAWSNLAAQSAEQIALAAAPIVAVLTARRRRRPDRPAADRADAAVHPVRDPGRPARRPHLAALADGGRGSAAGRGAARHPAADRARRARRCRCWRCSALSRCAARSSTAWRRRRWCRRW